MNFRFATREDTDRIIEFLRDSWRSDHVYVRHPELLLYDFQNGDNLNFGLLELNGDVHGVFGYFFYNEGETPDIGGMIWKVSAIAEEKLPLAGFALRDFVVSQVPHRFYGAPGAGPQTKSIYRVLGMKWIEMDHFYGVTTSGQYPEFVSVKTPGTIRDNSGVKLQKVTSASVLSDVVTDLAAHQVPEKSPEYVIRRYLDNPFRNYNCWLCSTPERHAVVVARMQVCQGVSVMRIIDYLGDTEFAAEAIAAAYSACKHSVAYVDFVCSGFDSGSFFEHGFDKVDFENAAQVVPSLFEPFVEKSHQLYAQASPGFEKVVMVKGNGDQDRPNVLA